MVEINQSILKTNKQNISRQLNLENILKVVSPHIKLLDSQILKNAETDHPLLNKISEHILSSGGKRLRPALVILGAELFDGVNERIMKAAQVIEYLHTATLLHDDVVDGALTRRNKLAVCRIWGNDASVISGDYLLAMAFNNLTKLKNLEVMDLISDTTTKMAKGELLQLMRSFETINEEEYLEIIINKTACLFGAAIKTGCLLAGAEKESANLLYEYGMKLGIAFQLVDDALDYSDEKKTGKPVGVDLQERKITLPLSELIKKANDSDKKRLFSILSLKKIEKPHIDEVIDLMKKYRSIDYTLDVSRKYTKQAKKIVEELPPKKLNQTLKEIADYIVLRQF